MPGKHHVAGATGKENRMYEHIKASESKQGRSAKTAKRIAAATVNKTRAKKGETKTKSSSRSRSSTKSSASRSKSKTH